MLVLPFIWPYFHKQLFWGGGGSCHLPITAKGSKGPGVTHRPHHHLGPGDHGSFTPLLIPGCVAAGHFVSRHRAGKKPGWHLPQKKGRKLTVMGPGAVPAVLLLATSVIRKKKNKIKNRCKEQHVFFLRPAELSWINHWGCCFFLQTLGEAGEICWEPEHSGQGCPAKRRLQPVLGMEEQGSEPRAASGGV